MNSAEILSRFVHTRAQACVRSEGGSINTLVMCTGNISNSKGQQEATDYSCCSKDCKKWKDGMEFLGARTIHLPLCVLWDKCLLLFKNFQLLPISL